MADILLVAVFPKGVTEEKNIAESAHVMEGDGYHSRPGDERDDNGELQTVAASRMSIAGFSPSCPKQISHIRDVGRCPVSARGQKDLWHRGLTERIKTEGFSLPAQVHTVPTDAYEFSVKTN